MIYITLFITALLSATILPLGSEALVIYDIQQEYNIAYILIVATLGNTIGSIINYYLGRKGELYLKNKKYLTKEFINKYKIIFNKYGAISLLFSWLPLIGDPITFIAGMLKYNIKKFILLVLIAKFLRYLVVTIVTLEIINTV